MTDTPEPQDPVRRQVEGLSTLIQLEQEARKAENTTVLAFLMANETHRLTPYRQGLIWRHDRAGKTRLATLSGTANFDRATPMVQWLERLGGHLAESVRTQPLAVVQDDLPSALSEAWTEWLPAHMSAIPIVTSKGQRLATLGLLRDTPWRDGENALLARLAEAYAHAWHALEPQGPPLASRAGDILLSRRTAVAIAVIVVVAMFMPVRQSSLAQAEVVAAEPAVVSTPMDGVIKTFHIEPNQAVDIGSPLFDIDDTRLRNRRDVAERALDVARAQLERAVKRSFSDAESRGQIAILRAQVAEREAELAFTQEQLAKVAIKADRPGIAVFRDANDWIGRPVGTGERILIVADPRKVELRMALPVDDLLAFPDDAAVRLFLNIAPMAPRQARLRDASYEAAVTDEGILAYELTADFDDDASPPRIGLKGTAKVYGENVSLFWYLMRKPLSAARRGLGF